MSDFEMLNQRVAAKMAARRKDTLRRLAFVLGIVLAVVLALVGLEYIGFISEVFMVILIAVTVCAGSFRAGRIWDGLTQ